MAIGMGSSVVDVGVAITLQNRFSTEAGRVSQDFKNLMNEANNYSRAMNMGSGALLGVAGNVLNGLSQAFQYSAKVTGEVWRAGQVAGASAAEQEQLLQKAFEVNRLTPISAMEAASAERYLAMAGNKSKQIQDMLQPAAELGSILGATIGGKGGVADLMTNIMATYGIESSKAASVTDDLYTAVTNANMSLDDLAQAITYAGSYANTAGISLRETAAAIGVMGNQGIQGSRAGVALGNMLNYLMQSLSGARPQGMKALQAWGIDPESLVDSTGKLISLKNTMNVLGNVMSKMTGLEQIKFLKEVMQVRATRATVALYTDMFREMSKGGQTFDKIMGAYDANQGVVHEKTLEYLNTAQGALDELSSTWENLVVVVGQSFAPWVPIIRMVSNVLQKLVEVFQGDSFGKWLIQWVAMVSITGLVVNAFRLMRNTLRMINGLSTAFNVKTGTLSRQVAAANTQWAAMEAHLINILRMMGQMMVMQARMMGFRFIKRKDGAVDLRDSKGRIRGIWGSNMGDYLAMGMMAGMSTGGMGSATSSAATSALGGRRGIGVFGTSMTKTWLARRLVSMGTNKALGLGILRGVGLIGGTLGKFMGPLGWTVSFALPWICDGIARIAGSSEETANNTSKKDFVGGIPYATYAEGGGSIYSRIAPYLPEYGAAMKRSLGQYYEVNLLVNGRRVGTFTENNTRLYATADADALGLYN